MAIFGNVRFLGCTFVGNSRLLATNNYIQQLNDLGTGKQPLFIISFLGRFPQVWAVSFSWRKTREQLSCPFHFRNSRCLIPVILSYCWWTKSCTTWDVQNPVNNGINYQPQLVSRISEPSRVSLGIHKSKSHGLMKLWKKNTNIQSGPTSYKSRGP